MRCVLGLVLSHLYASASIDKKQGSVRQARRQLERVPHEEETSSTQYLISALVNEGVLPHDSARLLAVTHHPAHQRALASLFHQAAKG